MIKIIECPRDAMQGIKSDIPTNVKVEYINQLLEVGFDTIDFGSFVSPKAVPQMADTADVLKELRLSEKSSKLLSIVANPRGARDACVFDEIDYLGYPFSISETFQMRNANSTIEESLSRVGEIAEIARNANKKVVIYISMAFGNPYGDPYDPEIAAEWSERLHRELGIDIIALSDTVGSSTRENIHQLFSELIPALPKVEFGAHLHTTPNAWREKVDAAYNAGCRRFDGALKGFGGCPMAADELTGNMPTENLIAYFEEQGIETGINKESFKYALKSTSSVFPL
ncbi:MAG: hydroxymethylglutaryl-CoA lyase [Cryomorphaceae bacterium]|nr:hydroxymethylglutaryl-CoA lyase [Flavobacteriales bacterium]